MTNYNDLTYPKGTKAETLISQLDIKDDFCVRMEGIFSRNYSEDLIGIEEIDDKTFLKLSRDGIFHLLPEGLFFEGNRVKNIPKHDFSREYKKFKEEKERIELFFQLFDTTHFKLSLELEKKLNRIAEQRNDIFTNAFFDEPEVEEDNQYISGIKKLLPFASELRGNFALLTDILKNIFSVEKIEIVETEPFHRRFIIHKEGLSQEEYLLMDEELVPFFDFFSQWFLPVEMEYDFRLKDYKTPFTLGNILLLDYNTRL